MPRFGEKSKKLKDFNNIVKHIDLLDVYRMPQM